MKKYFVAGALLLSAFTVFGQDIHFSQYNLTPLVINPAQAGAYKNIEAIINYKSQWTSISPNAYKTAMLTGDMRLMQKKWKTSWLATGISIFSDKAGDGNMKTMQGNLSFGYHTQLNDKNTLGGALLAGFAQRSIDFSQLTWDEQYVNGTYNAANSSNEPVGNAKFGYPDFGLGILYQFNKGQMYSTANDMVIIHTGLALFHLNAPKYSYYDGSNEKLYTKIIGHADALIGIKNTNLSLVPGFLYMGQGPSGEILPGMYFRYMLREESKFTGYVKGASIMVGTHLRIKDAFIPSVQLEIAEYTLGISYDMNVSGLKSATSGKGGFEISLRYGNPNPFLYKSAASFQ
ncbi:MAG: PorP/SprF family type IX secretion system membrane protein [Bacteroidetes bacterium]|nr:PorP/SprF family type IX secretion system membrane protein [Bacteroidota bacterium]